MIHSQKTPSQTSENCRHWCIDCFTAIHVADGSPAYKELQREHRVRCGDCVARLVKYKLADLEADGWFDASGHVSGPRLAKRHVEKLGVDIANAQCAAERN